MFYEIKEVCTHYYIEINFMMLLIIDNYLHIIFISLDNEMAVCVKGVGEELVNSRYCRCKSNNYTKRLSVPPIFSNQALDTVKRLSSNTHRIHLIIVSGSLAKSKFNFT